MKFLYVITCLFFTSGIYAQGTVQSKETGAVIQSQEGDANSRGNIVSKENCQYLTFDDNLFYCNWSTDQTFAYLNTPVQLTGNEIITLLTNDEQFVLPRYGTLWSGFKKGHNGLDIHLNTGDSIRAAFNGVVRYAMYNKGGFGNLVIIRHNNGLETYYAHLSDMFVKSGTQVKAGQVIGLGGSTGRSRGPHLHFEVRFHDKPLDPLSFINYEARTLKANELKLTREIFEPWNLHIDRIKEQYASNEQRKIVSEDTRPENFTVDVKYESTASKSVNVSQSSTAKSSGTKYYTVKSGDSLYKISKMYGTTVSSLCKLNGIKESSILQIGQKIRYQ